MLTLRNGPNANKRQKNSQTQKYKNATWYKSWFYFKINYIKHNARQGIYSPDINTQSAKHNEAKIDEAVLAAVGGKKTGSISRS